MNWILIVRYAESDRYVGPFPTQEDALRWVNENGSPLWLGCKAVPLEAPKAPESEYWSPSWR